MNATNEPIGSQPVLPPKRGANRNWNWRLKQIKKYWQLYLFVFPTLIYFLIFEYYPMYGLQIAFKDFHAGLGIWGSEWVGLKHFERFFGIYSFWSLLRNTFLISLYQLALFPISVIVALALHECYNLKFKKLVQTITYAPHFISLVVMVGMVIVFLNPETGIINNLLAFLGFERIAFMTEPSWFKTIFVLSGEWQSLGWGAIIYLAALSAVNPELHEAAKIDGATRLQRIFHINIPGIMPTIIILLILNFGGFMNVGFQKVLLLQNDLNMPASDVIQTYVYRVGVQQAQFSFATAVGLFNNMVNFILLIIFNRFARRTGTSLW